MDSVPKVIVLKSHPGRLALFNRAPLGVVSENPKNCRLCAPSDSVTSCENPLCTENKTTTGSCNVNSFSRGLYSTVTSGGDSVRGRWIADGPAVPAAMKDPTPKHRKVEARTKPPTIVASPCGGY